MSSTAPKPVVKNGKFYHVYNYGQPNERWVYVREAAATTGIVKGPATSSAPTALKQPEQTAPLTPAAATTSTAVPIVAPFLTGSDLTEIANFNFEDSSSRADIDKALTDLAAQTGYDKTSIEDSALRNRVGTADDMVARGLFRSSVKDASIADIEKNRVLQQGQLDDRLRIATTDAGNRKNMLDQRRNAYLAALAQRQVENARPINDANATAAAAAAPAATPATTQASGGYKNVVKNGKFYHQYPDGRLVYIRPASSRP